MAFKMTPRGSKRSNPYSGLMKKGLISGSPLYQATKTQTDLDTEADTSAQANLQKNIDAGSFTSTSSDETGNYFNYEGKGDATDFSKDDDQRAKEKLWIKNHPEEYARLMSEKNAKKTIFIPKEKIVEGKKETKGIVSDRGIGTSVKEQGAITGYTSNPLYDPMDVKGMKNKGILKRLPVYADVQYREAELTDPDKVRSDLDENITVGASKEKAYGLEDGEIAEDYKGSGFDKSGVQQRGPIFQRRHNTVTTSPMKQIKDKELDTFEINVTKENNDKAPDGFKKKQKTEGTRIHKDGTREKIGGSRTIAGNF